MRRAATALLLSATFDFGCGRPPQPPTPPPSTIRQTDPARAWESLHLPKSDRDPFPQLLSQSPTFPPLPSAAPSSSAIPYVLNLPFHAGGASKRRRILLPPGQQGHFPPPAPWTFPPHTLFIKEFAL